MCENVAIHGTETTSLRSDVPKFDGLNATGERKAPLFHRTFLATPYLSDDKGYEFRKFSGTENAGSSGDLHGLVVDAFAHFVHDASDGQYVFVDLQGEDFAVDT